MYPKNLQYHQKIIFLPNSKKPRQWIGPLTFTTRSTNGKAVATVTLQGSEFNGNITFRLGWRY